MGRDKPWQRYDARGGRGGRPDSADDLCARLREKDGDTCGRYLETQAMWWRAFGTGRCLIVGDSARGRRQGFVIDAFEMILRVHRTALPPIDVGNVSQAGSTKCDDVRSCVQAAAGAGCTGAEALLSLGSEAGLPPGTRTLLDDVYRTKNGIFGGPGSRTQ